MADFEKILRETSYPGRGIMIGRTADGTKAVTAYFIMGRSVNSRMEDPSLIIYAPVRVYGNKTIVTNGDQTDTIYEGLDKQFTFEQSLRSREFEPDAPNYTPRISGVMHVEKNRFNYAMSILKSDQGDPSSCLRYTFAYENPKAGEGRFISTYMGDGNPLPSFEGEPRALELVAAFTENIDVIASGNYETRIVNKNQ